MWLFIIFRRATFSALIMAYYLRKVFGRIDGVYFSPFFDSDDVLRLLEQLHSMASCIAAPQSLDSWRRWRRLRS